MLDHQPFPELILRGGRVCVCGGWGVMGLTETHSVPACPLSSVLLFTRPLGFFTSRRQLLTQDANQKRPIILPLLKAFTRWKCRTIRQTAALIRIVAV